MPNSVILLRLQYIFKKRKMQLFFKELNNIHNELNISYMGNKLLLFE